MSTFFDDVTTAAAIAIQQHSHRLLTLPIVVVYLNNICDSRCQTCSIWKNNEFLKEPAQRQMSDDLLARLYTFLREWQPRQVLVSGGEPALHPRFTEVIDNLAAFTPKVSLITNGLLLASLAAQAIEKIADFYISFDAPDRETYKTIRGVDGFEKLAAGMARLRTIAPKPAIVARCTLQRDNVRLIPELVGAAKRMGFDSISFLGVDINSDSFSRDVHGMTNVSGTLPSRDDLEKMANDVDAISATPDGFIEGGVEKLQQILHYFHALLGDTGFPPTRCNAPWVSVVVQTSGKIRGCFFQRVMGDIDSINGKDAVAFRRSLNVRNDSICERCVCSKWLGPRDVMRMVD